MCELTKFAELTVRNQQSTQGTKSIESLVAMLLCGTLVDRGTWELGIATRNKSRLPQKILQQVAFVLSQEQNLGLFDDISKVADEVAAFWR